MKLKIYLKYLSYYILGYLIFNIIFALINTILIHLIGGHYGFMENLLLNFTEILIIYTILFIGLILLNTVYIKKQVKELNEQLNKFRERSGKDEK